MHISLYNLTKACDFNIYSFVMSHLWVRTVGCSQLVEFSFSNTWEEVLRTPNRRHNVRLLNSHPISKMYKALLRLGLLVVKTKSLLHRLQLQDVRPSAPFPLTRASWIPYWTVNPCICLATIWTPERQALETGKWKTLLLRSFTKRYRRQQHVSLWLPQLALL